MVDIDQWRITENHWQSCVIQYRSALISVKHLSVGVRAINQTQRYVLNVSTKYQVSDFNHSIDIEGYQNIDIYW